MDGVGEMRLQSPSDLAQGDPAQLVLSRTPPHASIPWATSRGKRGGKPFPWHTVKVCLRLLPAKVTPFPA